jgi:hypothetical protein
MLQERLNDIDRKKRIASQNNFPHNEPKQEQRVQIRSKDTAPGGLT